MIWKNKKDVVATANGGVERTSIDFAWSTVRLKVRTISVRSSPPENEWYVGKTEKPLFPTLLI